MKIAVRTALAVLALLWLAWAYSATSWAEDRATWFKSLKQPDTAFSPDMGY